jgi:hypothetical protein
MIAENLFDSLEQKRRHQIEAARGNPAQESMTVKLIAEQDVLGSWRYHGDSDSLEHFSRCLRMPPFTITRFDLVAQVPFPRQL